MPIKHIFTLLFLLFAIQATGKRDSMLWVNIKEMGQTYQKGLRDSALAKAKRLLLVAEEQNVVYPVNHWRITLQDIAFGY